jgi:hypothetical protein
VHLAVCDDPTQRSAITFLLAVLVAMQFRARIVLTGRGASLKAAFRDACETLSVERRRTRTYRPETNKVADRFDDQVQREVLNMIVGSHCALEALLLDHNLVYDLRKQRVLQGGAPTEMAWERLRAHPEFENPGVAAYARRCVGHGDSRRRYRQGRIGTTD